MSGKATGWAWDQKLPKHLKYVLLAYADFADHAGEDIYPSINLVSEMTDLDRRTVQRHTKELKRLGYLIADGRDGRGRNRYKLPLKERAAPMPPRGGTHATPGGGTGVPEGAAPMPPDPPRILQDEPPVDSESTSGGGHKHKPGMTDLGEISLAVQAWERAVGPITPMIAEHLLDLANIAQAHTEKLPPKAKAAGAHLTGVGWLCAAIQEAAKSSPRRFNVKYVQRILERWYVDGFQADLRPEASPADRATGVDFGEQQS